ncbi:MAG: redoxin family protein [Deltaproteobacteria bacterium]|nr:redoxin family protein [Deltaproteobacteria bacterium]
MKKIISVVFLVLFCSAFVSYAAELKVGDKAGDFKLSAALDDKEYSLSSPEFAGKAVYIVYASTSSADDNDHVSDALEANNDVQRLKSEKKYVGLGIGNQKDSPVPNFIIKQVAKSKQKKTGAIILLDPDFTIGNLWGVPHKIATSILIDKQRVVRYIYSGKTPAENIPKIVDLIKKYSE